MRGAFGSTVLMIAALGSIGGGLNLAGYERTTIRDDKLREGWERSVAIPNPKLGEGDRYVVWVEDGWLQARRETRSGNIDWHIVLARATDTTPPAIVAKADTNSFEVSYRDGRYFIRDDAWVLRCVRERKQNDEGTLPTSRFIDDSFFSAGSAGSPDQPPLVAGWTRFPWFVVSSGPTRESLDCMLRLNLMKTDGNYGFEAFNQSNLKRAFQEQTWVFDDGELLFANRGLKALVKAQREREANREALLGAAAPPLPDKGWLNADEPLACKQLEGKVVLVDFWATWCLPCVKKLPEVEALYKKYREEGFVVIGVHDPQGADQAEQFIKQQKLSFPIVLDTGDTLLRYGVESLPSYVLVGKDGKVATMLSKDLPTEEQIEPLLHAK